MFGYSKNLIFTSSILIGTIVGAGIFGIPYVVSRSGIIPGFFYLIFLGAALLLIHLFYGEVILRTKDRHHLPALAEKYLGKKGKVLITISTFVGMTGVLLAYTILGGEFLKIIFSSFTVVSSFHLSLFFLASLSYFVFRGIKIIAPTELVTNFIFFSILFVIFFFALPEINFNNFVLFNLPQSFLPYGVILFSLIGFPAMPVVGGILNNPGDKKNLRAALTFSFIVVVLIYIIFVSVVVGVSGKGTSPETLQGLIPFFGPKIIIFGALAAIITLVDSFLTIALSFKNTMVYDYKISKLSAFIIACGLPLALFLLGFRSFIGTIGFVGTIIGAIEGIAIILIFKNAKTKGDKEPEYKVNVSRFVLYLLIMVFVLGAVSQIFL
ncbi:MAG: aromatic amino acid transport family protein [Candidatus Nealsonbacteria bacterium]